MGDFVGRWEGDFVGRWIGDFVGGWVGFVRALVCRLVGGGAHTGSDAEEEEVADESDGTFSAADFPTRNHSSAMGSPAKLLGSDGGSDFNSSVPSIPARFIGS